MELDVHRSFLLSVVLPGRLVEVATVSVYDTVHHRPGRPWSSWLEGTSVYRSMVNEGGKSTVQDACVIAVFGDSICLILVSAGIGFCTVNDVKRVKQVNDG